MPFLLTNQQYQCITQNHYNLYKKAIGSDFKISIIWLERIMQTNTITASTITITTIITGCAVAPALC